MRYHEVGLFFYLHSLWIEVHQNITGAFVNSRKVTKLVNTRVTTTERYF